MPRSHDRADDQTTMTVSLPKTLRDKIDRFAAAERRTRSNWVVKELEELVTAREAEKKLVALPPAVGAADPSSEPTARVAEHPPIRYPAKRRAGSRGSKD